MTREVVFVRPETPVGDVARLMVKYNISGVPVVENDKVIGIVTEEDLIMRDAIVDMPHVFSLFDSVFYVGSKKHFEEEMQKILATEASGLMTGRAVLISEEASVQELATVMMKKEVNPIPVIGPDGHLSGIVSRSDLVRLMVRELASEDEPPVEPSTAEGVNDTQPRDEV
jgi:CBS domain-containing protein